MDLIQTYMQESNYIGIFLTVFLEYANFPLPSEIILPMVGFFVGKGYISFYEALAVSVAAGIIGSIINYLLGKYFGNPLVGKFVKNNEKLKRSLNESLRWIDKYGNLSVMLSRVVPLIRTFISIPAGIVKMPLLSFTIYSGIGIFIWNAFLISAGMLFADSLGKVAILLKGYSVVVGIILVVVAGYILTLIKKKRNI